MAEPFSAGHAHTLIESFLETLRELPDVRAERDMSVPPGWAGKRLDAIIDLYIADRKLVLLAGAKNIVYPRDVHQALWQFEAWQKLWQDENPGVETQRLLLAQSLSPGAKDLLKVRRVGYYDRGGSLFLSAPGLYLYIDEPPPKVFEKSMRSLFSGQRAKVLHALLLDPRKWVGVTEIATQTQVAVSTASEVLSELERLDWLDSRGKGPGKERHLREPAALLDAWAKQLGAAPPLDLRRYYVPATKPEALLKRIGEAFDAHGAEYAISHEAAAQRYTPFLSNVSQVRARLLTDSHADDALGDLGARAVSEGANLALIEVRSPGDLLFRERIDGLWLASPIQIYLDLLSGEGRSKEMAEHFRKERIGF